MNDEVLKIIRRAAKTLEAEGKIGICNCVEHFLIAENLNQSTVKVENTEIHEIILYAARILEMKGNASICKSIENFLETENTKLSPVSTEGLLVNIASLIWTQQMLKIRFNGAYVFPNAFEFTEQILERLKPAKTNKNTVAKVVEAVIKAAVIVMDPFSKEVPAPQLPYEEIFCSLGF